MVKSGKPIAVNASFEVAYEDEDVIVVNKAAPLLVHPTGREREYTLLQGVQELLSYELTTGGSLCLINRLDRETSGLVLIAKHPSAAHELGCAMQQQRIHKQYLAVVRGQPVWEYACCAEALAPAQIAGISAIRVRRICHPSGKPSRTEFFTLKREKSRGKVPAISLIRCIPTTGRMHQIRAHLAHLGYPILGDKIYGGDESCYLRFMKTGWSPELAHNLIMERHALHACDLDFPLHGRRIRVHSQLPADMAALIT